MQNLFHDVCIVTRETNMLYERGVELPTMWGHGVALPFLRGYKIFSEDNPKFRI